MNSTLENERSGPPTGTASKLKESHPQDSTNAADGKGIDMPAKPTIAEVIAAKKAAAKNIATPGVDPHLQAVISVCKIIPDSMFIQRDVSIADALEEIRSGRYAKEIGKVRTLVARHGKDSDQVKAAKLELPAYLFSGRIDGRVAQAMNEGRFHHSGIMQLDFDGIEDPKATRDMLAKDPHCLAAWISPSGTGVKGLCRIPAAAVEASHKASFENVCAYYLDRYKLINDKACNNSNRLCFAGWDSELRLNLAAVPLVNFEPLPKASEDQSDTCLESTDETIAKQTGVSAPLVIRSKAFPEPPEHGIHDPWLPRAARWCESNGMSEAEAVAKLYSYEGRLRRKYSKNEPEDACAKIYSTPLEPQAKPRVQALNGRPAIELPCPGRPLSDFAANVGAMLAGRGVYSRGGLAFTVDLATKQLSPVDPQWLRTWAEGEVSLFKQAKTAAGLSITLRHSMSLDVARALVVSPQFLEPLPEIKRFAPVRMPVMRADGRIELLPEGFDSETLTLTDPNGCKYRTDHPAELGAKAIRSALAEFPFADERSRAAAVAAMLTVYAGGLLPPASTNPAFIYLANAEGSGKTTLAQLAGIPYGVCEAESKPATEEEWQKTLLALVMGGARLLLLDNLKGHLNSPSFEAYLTATKFSGRILGVNKKFSGEADAVVLLTGNRLTVSPDLRRRCIFVELFMEELRAEDRVFKRRLDAPAILELQPGLLEALWCMVRGWDQAGRPPASKINSSVPRWSEVIAGIVEWAGFSCPSVPAELEDGGDTDTRDIAGLGEAMQAGQEMKFSELCDLCAKLGFFERFTDDTEPLHKVKMGGELIRDESPAPLTRKAKREFSAILSTYSGRMIAPGKRFMSEGKGHQRRYVTRETEA